MHLLRMQSLAGANLRGSTPWVATISRVPYVRMRASVRIRLTRAGCIGGIIAGIVPIKQSRPSLSVASEHKSSPQHAAEKRELRWAAARRGYRRRQLRQRGSLWRGLQNAESVLRERHSGNLRVNQVRKVPVRGVTGRPVNMWTIYLKVLVIGTGTSPENHLQRRLHRNGSVWDRELPLKCPVLRSKAGGSVQANCWVRRTQW